MTDFKEYPVKYYPIDKLKPAPYNPRKISSKELEKLQRSIDEFGFVQPVIINQVTGFVVGGHQRIKAAKELGYKRLPVIETPLTEDQEKALNVALNKISGEWDLPLLKDLFETLDTGDFDLTLTGFDINQVESMLVDFPEEVTESFRDSQIDFFNFKHGFFESAKDNPYGIPMIESCTDIPTSLIGFNYVKSAGKKQFDNWVHFFLDDYQFERVWNDPARYPIMLEKFPGCLGPDFSLYTDFPLALQIFNIYRNRWLICYWQSKGLKVIPTIAWSTKESFDFCFSGIPKSCPVAVSTVGVMKDKDAIYNFMVGFNKMVEVIQPETVICYGEKVPELNHDNVIYFKAFQQAMRQNKSKDN